MFNAESKVQRRQSFIDRETEPSQALKNISIVISPSVLNLVNIRAHLKSRSAKQHTTEADCDSARFAGASTRIAQTRQLDHAGARAQSPAQEGLLLANLQGTKARSLQRKCATEQHPSPHPPSCLVLDRRRPSHHLWLQSPHLEPRSSEC
jgi:hypothetical protein